MKIIKTCFRGAYIIECSIFEDSRGWFYESFRQDKFEKVIKNIRFVQDNQSFSKYGTLRGMHFQKKPHQQAKLVRVITGEIQDVIIDLRTDSETYLKYFSIVLSDKNKKQLFVPHGFAHGFLVMSDWAEVLYKCDTFYNKEAESGILYNDSMVDIKWLLEKNQFIISEKDKAHKPLYSLM